MKSINIQDQFLNQIRKENTFVTVFLLNGFQLRGQVKGFDNFTVLIESEGKQQAHIQTRHFYVCTAEKRSGSNWNSDSRTKRPCLAWFFQIA